MSERQYLYICDRKKNCSWSCKGGLEPCCHTTDPNHAVNPLPKTEEEIERRFEHVRGTNRYIEVDAPLNL